MLSADVDLRQPIGSPREPKAIGIDGRHSAPAVIALLLLGALLSGCAQTVQSQPSAAGSDATVAANGFLGGDAALLKSGEEGQALLVYINPNTKWTQYGEVKLRPVEFWDAANSDVSQSDQQMLAEYFYNKLKEDLQKNFVVVDQVGPEVVVLQTAIISASTATPVLRSVSVVIPQARIINGLQSLASGSYAFVGSAEAAMKATDAQTGELLAAAVDERKGGMALSTAAQWKWGDAENAMDFWADRIASRFYELHGQGS
jgi:hypothetical protein